MKKSRKKDNDNSDQDWSNLPQRVQRIEKLVYAIIVALVIISCKLFLSPCQNSSYATKKDVVSLHSQPHTFEFLNGQEKLKPNVNAHALTQSSRDHQQNSEQAKYVDSSQISAYLRDSSGSLSGTTSYNLESALFSSKPQALASKTFEVTRENTSVTSQQKEYFNHQDKNVMPSTQEKIARKNYFSKMNEAHMDYTKTSSTTDKNYIDPVKPMSTSKHNPDIMEVGTNAKERTETKHGSPNVVTTRNLQATTTNIKCNDEMTLFELQLHLGTNASENSWTLKNENNGTIVASQVFSNDNDSSSINFGLCLEPSPYTFTLRDEAGNGFDCDFDSQGCHNIFLDKELVIKGTDFVGSMIVNKFDTSSTCVLDNTVVLTKDKNVAEEEWSIIEVKSGQEVVFVPTIAEDRKGESFLACLAPGSYVFEANSENIEESSCNDIEGCYSMTINNFTHFDITVDNPLQRIISSGQNQTYFRISKDRMGHKQICPFTPILSSSNLVNTFVFNDKTTQKFDMIYSISSFDDVHNRNTAQYKAACWMIYDDINDDVAIDGNWLQQYIFLVLLHSTHQETDILPANLCDYDENRVECEVDGFLKSINFGGLHTMGQIPSEISFLRRLEHLFLNENKLTGTIPSTMGELWRLKTLYLEDNKFSGTIFSEIGNMIGLEELLVGKNHLSGTIPSEIGHCSALGRLGINQNKIKGSIPTQFFGLSELQGIALFDNEFTGTLPIEIGNLDKLQFLRLENNNLSGSMPAELCKLPLQFLSMNDNLFTGSLPQQIGQLTELERIFLSSNQFGGSIIDSFENMTKLEVVVFFDNLLTGTIPSSIFELKSLNVLHVKSNNFKDNISPDCEQYEIFHVDNSVWLSDEPEIKCDCCDIEECRVWNLESTKLRAPCPESNIHEFKYFSFYEVNDTISESTHHGGSFAKSGEAKVCLSPTGCYSLRYFDKEENDVDENEHAVEKTLSFASESFQLEENGICDAVMICDEIFDPSHPRRILLNHLAQTVSNVMDESETKYKSLCWMLIEDEMYEKYQICDGTLLQRYIIGTFYLTTGLRTDLSSLSDVDTCDWPGVTCDMSNRFIEKFNMTGIASNESLQGNLMTEIGLLRRLKSIDMSNNTLSGNIDSSVFMHMPELEEINFGNNEFEGQIPTELFALPKIIRIDLNNNTLDGSLQDGITYAESLEFLNLARNFFRGTIPLRLFDSYQLKHLDLSENSFSGDLPREIGTLQSLRELHLNQNLLLGKIPSGMFDATKIEVLALYSNTLTGSIPTEVGYLVNATNILMDHNILKSTIPSELGTLENLMLLHLHNSKLTGTAPSFVSKKMIENFEFITDCNSALDLTCQDCTLCCDGDDNCRKFDSGAQPLYVNTTIALIITPIIFAIFFVIAHYVRTRGYLPFLNYKPRPPLSIYNEESVYCYLFSESPIAWCIHGLIFTVQVTLFFSFQWASDPTNSGSIISSSFICIPESVECINQENLGWSGWLLFFVLTFLYLGTDIVNALLQIRKSMAKPFDLRLLTNGCLLMGLTVISLTSSYAFNVATAGTNIDLIVNAVVLLFINDLDEQTLAVIDKMFPTWNENRVEEIKDYLTRRQETIDERESLRKSVLAQKSPRRDLVVDREIPAPFDAESIYVGTTDST